MRGCSPISNEKGQEKKRVETHTSGLERSVTTQSLGVEHKTATVGWKVERGGGGGESGYVWSQKVFFEQAHAGKGELDGREDQVALGTVAVASGRGGVHRSKKKGGMCRVVSCLVLVKKCSFRLTFSRVYRGFETFFGILRLRPFCFLKPEGDTTNRGGCGRIFENWRKTQKNRGTKKLGASSAAKVSASLRWEKTMMGPGRSRRPPPP